MHRLICGLVGKLAAATNGRKIDDILSDSETTEARVLDWDNAQFWTEGSSAAGAIPAVRPK
ncbi:MAG: hypothetical protein AB8G99_18395 [Planctomycetaceae bacterium]